MNSAEFLKPLRRAGLNYGRHNLQYYPPHWWTSIPPPNFPDTRKNYVTVENRIHIFGILPEVTEEDIHEEFSIFGPIAAIVIIRNQCHLKNGFAFVTYHLEKYAQLALQGSSRRFFKGNLIFVNAAIQNEKYVNYQEVQIKRLYSMKTLLYIKKKYDKYFLDQVNDLLYVNPCHEFLQEIDATIPRHLKRSTFCNNSFSDNDSCSISSTSADDESFSDDESVYSFKTVAEIPGTPANSESTTSENSWKWIPDYFHGLHNDNDLDDFIYPNPQYFEGIQYVGESSNLDSHEDENPMTIESRYYNESDIIYHSPISQHYEVLSYLENDYDHEYSTWQAYQEEVLENINRELYYVNPYIEEYNHWNRFIVDIADGDDMQLVAFQPKCPQTLPIVYEYPVNNQRYSGARLIDGSASRVAQFEPIRPSLHTFYNFDFVNEIFNQLGGAEIINYANRQIKAFQGLNPLVLPSPRQNKINDYMRKLESILTNLVVYVTVQENKKNDQSCSGVHIIEISDQDNIQKVETNADNCKELESKVVCETTAVGESWEESPKGDFSTLSGHDVITQVSEVEELDRYEEETRTLYATCPNVTKSEK